MSETICFLCWHFYVSPPPPLPWNFVVPLFFIYFYFILCWGFAENIHTWTNASSYNSSAMRSTWIDNIFARLCFTPCRTGETSYVIRVLQLYMFTCVSLVIVKGQIWCYCRCFVPPIPWSGNMISYCIMAYCIVLHCSRYGRFFVETNVSHITRIIAMRYTTSNILPVGGYGQQLLPPVLASIFTSSLLFDMRTAGVVRPGGVRVLAGGGRSRRRGVPDRCRGMMVWWYSRLCFAQVYYLHI